MVPAEGHRARRRADRPDPVRAPLRAVAAARAGRDPPGARHPADAVGQEARGPGQEDPARARRSPTPPTRTPWPTRRCWRRSRRGPRHDHVGQPGPGGDRAQLRRGGRPPHLRQLPAAAGAAGPAGAAGDPARPRRAAVHHRAPGLRALVQAAAARADRGPRRHAAGRDLAGPAAAAARARDRAAAGEPGRRARDHDTAGLPAVPRRARARQRLPVGAVPRARVPVRGQGSPVRDPVPGPDRRRARPPRPPPGRADAVGRLPRAAAVPGPPGGRRRSDPGVAGHRRQGPGPPRRPVAAGRGPADPRRAGRALAGPARADGGAADRHEVGHRRIDRGAVSATRECLSGITPCCGNCEIGCSGRTGGSGGRPPGWPSRDTKEWKPMADSTTQKDAKEALLEAAAAAAQVAPGDAVVGDVPQLPARLLPARGPGRPGRGRARAAGRGRDRARPLRRAPAAGAGPGPGPPGRVRRLRPVPRRRRHRHRRHAVPGRLGADGAAAGTGPTTLLVVHPQLRVRRDVSGTLREVLGLVDGDRQAHDEIAESWTHIEIARLPDGEEAVLQRDLQRVLGDVRVAVEDWPRMHAKAVHLAEQLAMSPDGAGSGPDSPAEAEALLRLAGRRSLHVPRLPRVRPGGRAGRDDAARRGRHRPGHPAARPGGVDRVRVAAARGPGPGPGPAAADPDQGELPLDRAPAELPRLRRG